MHCQDSLCGSLTRAALCARSQARPRRTPALFVQFCIASRRSALRSRLDSFARSRCILAILILTRPQPVSPQRPNSERTHRYSEPNHGLGIELARIFGFAPRKLIQAVSARSGRQRKRDLSHVAERAHCQHKAPVPADLAREERNNGEPEREAAEVVEEYVKADKPPLGKLLGRHSRPQLREEEARDQDVDDQPRERLHAVLREDTRAMPGRQRPSDGNGNHLQDRRARCSENPPRAEHPAASGATLQRGEQYLWT